MSQLQCLCLFCAMFVALLAQAQPPPDESTGDARDTLVFKDGDRLRGHLVQQANDLIVFKSDRFGEVRVPTANAVVIKADTPVASKASPASSTAEPKLSPTPEERAEQERVTLWERYSPAVLTAKVREFFGPWHGKITFSSETVTDTAHHNQLATEGKLSRKLEKDTIELGARYDFYATDGAPSTDVFKTANLWRHDFNRRQFSIYRPTIEWNRANTGKAGLPTEYVLSQQEIGFGVNLIIRPTRQFRVGVSENLFDLWGLNTNSSHTSRAMVSLFEEVEWTLPWRMSLTQRGVWYPESLNAHGFEDRIELNKKLTETLSVALRHEIRRNNPDGTSPDYTRLKLLLGFDF